MVNYVVQPGDTLWRIARQFGVPPEAIARENNLLDPNLVFPGQILVIPTAGVPPAPKAPGPSPPLPMPPVVPPPGLRIYVVQPGDTLTEIAARYGVSVEAIARANNIANPDLIYAGQILVIPVAAPPVPPVPPVTPPPPPITPPPIPPAAPVTPPPTPLPVRGNYSTRLEGGILYMLYTNRRVYRRGDNVRMIFSKTNVQATPITLEYRTGQQFDILITRAGEEVWRWSHGKVFVLVVTQTTLAPGESQVFRELWTQVDNQGQPVPTGRYVVTAWNTSTNVEVTVDIEITE